MNRGQLFVGLITTLITFSGELLVDAEDLTIPTNLGRGADVEIRESQKNQEFGSGLYLGTNRGASDELGTRVGTKSFDGTFIGTLSSAQYMKFDISQLPVSSDSFWNGTKVWFRAFTRNQGNWRAWYDEPAAGIGLTEFSWRLRALDPHGTYDTLQTDQNGNPYFASMYKYDWDEGDSSSQSGITAYNAPGRKPFCITNACESGLGNTLGFYDEFDLDPNVIDLGSVPMPEFDIVGTTLPQLYPLTYEDPNGDLTQLVKDARDAGLNVITVITHSGADGTNVALNPSAFYGRNQLIVPKERTTVIEPDDNIVGKYSPQLIVVSDPLPGDFNFDGTVDAADYTVWRDGLGTTYTAADYQIWRDNYGDIATNPTAVNAPEPSTLTLSTLACIGLVGRRSRSQATAA